MSTPGRAELVEALRALVTASGLDQTEVGRRVGKSKSTMSRYLNPSPRDGAELIAPPKVVQAIIDATGGQGSEAAVAALQLAEDLPGGNAGRVVILRGGTTTAQRKFGEAEAGTKFVREFTLTMPSGLLQTADYMRAIFASSDQSPAQQEDNVQWRLHRQERLDDPAHQFTLVTTEGALLHHVGSPVVMQEQCQAIAACARRDTGGRVRIGLIPWWRPRTVFPMSNMTMYDNRQVVIGTGFGTAFLDQQRDIAFYEEQFQLLCELAEWDAEAAAEAERIAEQYARLG